MRLTTLSSPRRGTTLVELAVVVVLLGLIVGGLLSVMDRQQRFYRETGAAAESRNQVRQAAAILPAELRALAPGDGDVIQALDSALEIRSTIGSGVVCERGPNWLVLAPGRPASGRTLGGQLVPPAPGDVARVLAADEADPSADRWLPFAIEAVEDDAETCLASPFVDPAADAGNPRLRLTSAGPLPAAMMPGAPVRLTRPVRYSLYRSSDRLWYLGVDEFNEGRWTGIQPVSGPYAAYGSAAGGVRFEYLDDAGTELTDPVDLQRLALIRLVIRSPAERGYSGSAGDSRSFADSAVVAVALRNRRR